MKLSSDKDDDDDEADNNTKRLKAPPPNHTPIRDKPFPADRKCPPEVCVTFLPVLQVLLEFFCLLHCAVTSVIKVAQILYLLIFTFVPSGKIK